ncbi:MAG: Holliday junction resolvase RuvX [Actinomycetota bacterium]|jgi:putative Holliday junction resolvase|nr:Holliday junction resolvase RuvX [Actinomycetota bacterium]HET8895750.1 Holliday junction resolvase RuvX [Protaetiibacter sp.]
MRRGVRVGVDVGKARVGVARCDPDGLLATPIETLPRDARTIAAVLAHGSELEAVEFVVGLPLSLSGADTASTTDARDFADLLARASETPVRLVDERLSTVTAHRQLQAGGRRAKSSRSVVDQVAAVIILQNALDSERMSDRPPGSVVPRTKDPERGL